MTSPLAHLGEIRTRGWKIFDELVNAKDTAQAIAAEGDWVPDLVTAVKPFSEWWAIKLGTLSPISGAEDRFALRHMRGVAPEDKHLRASIRSHAVRLLRLNELLDEIKDGTVPTPTRAAWKKAFAKPLAKKPAAKEVRKPVSAKAIETWLKSNLDKGKPNKNDAWQAARKHFYPKVVDRDIFRSLHEKIKAEQTV